MTFAVFRNSAGSQGGSTNPGAPITVPRSGGSPVQNTDTCLLICFGGGGSNASVPPDGTWATVKADATIASAAGRYALYSKVIGADTTIVPSWPTAPATGNNTAHLALFFSASSGIAAVGVPTSPGAASAVTVCAGTTTQGGDRVALALALMKGGSTGFPSSVVWAGGFTPLASQIASANFYPSIAVAAQNRPLPGSTAEQDATWNHSTLTQVGLQLAVKPLVEPRSLQLDISPNAGAEPLSVTATVIHAGGNGNPVTYSMDWDDGSTSPGQASSVFTHTYDQGEWDPVASASQV